jgi:hypothetical protein
LGFAASFSTLDKLVDKCILAPAALPIGDASLTHFIKLAAHSSTSSMPTAIRQSFIMTPYFLYVEFSNVYVNQSLAGQTLTTFLLFPSSVPLPMFLPDPLSQIVSYNPNFN